jgi:hypothetical protein
MIEPMTLVEKLRNPQWTNPFPPEQDARLDTEFTMKTMREAADEIERQAVNALRKG